MSRTALAAAGVAVYVALHNNQEGHVTEGMKYEVPTEMRDFAEKSVDQARKAFGGFLGAAQKAVDTLHGSTSTLQSSAADATRKSLSYAEQNIAAAFDHAQKIVRAKDLQEAMQIQSDFAKSQFAAMQGQLKDFGDMAQSAARSATSHATTLATEAATATREAAEKATSAMKGAASQANATMNKAANS